MKKTLFISCLLISFSVFSQIYDEYDQDVRESELKNLEKQIELKKQRIEELKKIEQKENELNKLSQREARAKKRMKLRDLEHKPLRNPASASFNSENSNYSTQEFQMKEDLSKRKRMYEYYNRRREQHIERMERIREMDDGL